VWDARITSTLVLLLLFFGLMALREAVPNAERGARAVALLAVVGVINIPIIKYSVEWFATLHQPASLTIGEKPAIAAVYLWPLGINALGYYCFAAGAAIAALRMRIVQAESGTEWVREWLRRSGA
jgi:heme exporter protein C